jgi:3'-phosphoadenosine 5'-phosphosulfate sulfotransferase (PAPS reductase)/FAD synthetase
MKHIVGFSGGIDSQACARFVLNHFPAEDVILLNTTAGHNEHPLTEAFVAEYSAKVFPVITIPALMRDMWKTPGFAETRGFDGEEELTFSRMVAVKGRPPSRKAQFCTEILKLRPQRRWMNANLFEEEVERWTGLRRGRIHRPQRHTVPRVGRLFRLLRKPPAGGLEKADVF